MVGVGAHRQLDRTPEMSARVHSSVKHTDDVNCGRRNMVHPNRYPTVRAATMSVAAVAQAAGRRVLLGALCQIRLESFERGALGVDDGS